ncbi:MAG: APC family permease [Gemmatimonadales bacterium]
MPGHPRSDAGSSTTSAGQQLERAIGPWALGANAVNLTVGAGIFALPAVVAGILGPAAILAYLICGFLILLVMACFAEAGSRVTRSGGAIAYVEEAFGPFAGFLTWVIFAIGFSTAADAAIAHVLMNAVAAAVPAVAGGWPRALGMILLFGGLAWVNIRGVREGTRLAVATTIAKLAPLVLLVVLGAFAIHRPNLAWPGWPTGDQLGAAALVLFFAFAGLESALTPSGEIRDPARTVPRGILGGAGAVVLLYVALQITAQGVLGNDLARSTAAPLAAVAERVAGGPGRTVLLAATAIAVFGAIAADMIGAPRAYLAAAESGTLPRVLRRIHPRFHTPWVSILAFAGLALFFALTGAFRPLAVLSSMALLLVYLGVCLAALRLRRTRASVPGAFRTPGGPAVPLLASATVLWVLAHSTWKETLAVAVLVAVSTAYYFVQGLAKQRPRPATAGATGNAVPDRSR